MDQKLCFKGARYSSIILSFFSIITLGLGISMVSSYPNEIWWVGLLLLLSGILCGYSAISTYQSAKKEKMLSDEQMAEMNVAKRSIPSDKFKVQILANWLYSVSEWKEFMKWEKRKSRSLTFRDAIILMVLGILGVHFLKGADWTISIIIGFALGIIYGVIKYFLALSSIQQDDNKMPEVIITNEAVIVNGRMNRFYGNNLWLGKVAINEAGSFNVLEITYCWYTRGGETFDELRVPIPKGSLKEAIFLQEKLMNEKKLVEQPY
jgi:uncharacterized membrane protein HdeD (DUF308 family)